MLSLSDDDRWSRDAMSETDRDQTNQLPLTIDWNFKDLAKVKQAAVMLDLSLEEFVMRTAIQEAENVIKSRSGVLSLAAAADFLGVSRGEVIKLISAGNLRAQKLDGEWFVDKESARKACRAEGIEDNDQIELDLRDLVDKTGISGLETKGKLADTASLTWCYVDREGILLCPRAAWRKFGRDRVMAEAKDAITRFIRRRDRDS